MREVGPIVAPSVAPSIGLGGSPGRPFGGRDRPHPPPASAGAPPPDARPTVEITRTGLVMEALVRPTAGPESGAILEGTVRVTPLPPGAASGPSPASAAPGAPWLEGERLAVVLGPAGPDGLLAEADGWHVVLRGVRLHLPPGAQLRIAWEGRPRPAERTLPSAPSAPQPSALDPRTAEQAERTPEPQPASRGPPGGFTGALEIPAPLGERAPMPLAEATRALAGLLRLGLVEARDDDSEEDRRRSADGERAESSSGRSRLVLDFPELGRIELRLAWDPDGVELLVRGLPPLAGEERAALLRAFEEGLAAAGARGRAVLVTAGSTSGTSAEEVAAGARTLPADPLVGGRGPAPG